MATTHRVRPMMALTNCHVIRPDRITPVNGDDVEQDVGAIGVGHAGVDGVPVLFLSLHQPGGDVLMAHMTPEHAACVAAQLTELLNRLARFVPGQPEELMN